MSAPELRFPGFEGGWKLRRLSEFMTFKNGVNADKSMYGHGRKFINVLDVIADRPIYHDDIIGEVSIPDKEFEKNEVVYGDVLFQRSSEVREEAGQSNVYLDVEQSATFGGFVIRGRPISEFDPLYFDALLKTSKARKDVTSRSGGSTRFNIGQESLSAVEVNVAPTLPEQKKIAAFWGVVDAKIAALRARLAGLERYKRGLMQALFSQTLRFTKPDGSAFPDWEEKRLGEVLDITSASRVHKDEWTEVGVPFFRSSDVVSYHKGLKNRKAFISNELFEKLAKKGGRVKKGDILVTGGGTIGVPYLVSSYEPMYFKDADLIWVKRSEGIDSFFLYYFFLAPIFRRYLKSISHIGTISHYTIEQAKATPFLLPSRAEQRKIASSLKAVDAKIAAVGDQGAKMEAFKKGLLQQMFV